MSLTSVVFLVAYFGALGAALVRHPIYGLYLYIAVFYLDPIHRWWASGVPDLRWSYTAAVITLLATILRRKHGQLSMFAHGPVVWLVVLVAWMWVITLWAVAPQDHWFGLLIYSKYLLVLYLFYVLVDSRERLGNVLLLHALGCLYFGVLAWTTSVEGRLDGVGGPGINDSNSLAMQVATGVYAAAGYYFAERSWRRFLAVPAVPFALNALVLAGSRGGFLALIGGGLVFYLFRPPGQQRVVLPYALMAVLLFGYTASDTFIQRMNTLTEPVETQAEADISVATRLELFKAQWQMALDHPLGIGNSGTFALSYTYMDPKFWSGTAGRGSHNSTMSALVEQGFPGAFIWLLIMVLLALKLRANRRWSDAHLETQAGWLNAGLAAMFAVVVIAGLFSPQERTEVYIWVLALACGFTHIMANAESRANVDLEPAISGNGLLADERHR